MTKQQKIKAYQLTRKQIDAVLEGETHMIAKMATINCMLRENLSYYFWTGFYLVHDGELIVGLTKERWDVCILPLVKEFVGQLLKKKRPKLCKM